MKKQYGNLLSIVLIIAIIVVVAILGFLGYKVYTSDQTNKKAGEAAPLLLLQFLHLFCSDRVYCCKSQ